MLAGAACLFAVLAAASAHQSLPGAGKSTGPIERVVELLEELKTNLEKDAKVDQELYDKFACWCEKTSTRKADGIEAAQHKLKMLGQLILKYKGGIEAGKKIVAELKEKLDEVREVLAKLEAIRSKENAKYMAESEELMQALAALEKAIIVLHEATKTSLLQDASGSAAAWRKAAAGVQTVVDAMPSSAKLSPRRETQVAAFLEDAAKAGGSPQSATIQGILKDMYDTMATDLETAAHDEATKNTQYEDLVYIKHKQQAAYEKDLDKNQRQIAEWDILLADSQILYAETEKQMKVDIEFLDNLKKMCDAKYKEFMTRKGLREGELDGITKALEILTDPENAKSFGKAIKPGLETSFLQLANDDSEGAPSMKAYRALKAQAMKTHSLRLAAIAAKVRMTKVGHFDEVIKAIDKMIGVLNDEAAADIKQRDDCKDEYQKVASDLAQLEWAIEKNVAKIKALEEAIKAREDEKVEAITEIEDTKKDITTMEDTRKEENAAFAEAKKADEDAIPVLEAAKDALERYYKENKIPLGPIQGDVKAVLLAEAPAGAFEVDPDQAPDATFKHKGSRKGESKGIISIITMIIEDLHGEIKTAIAAEAEAQTEFDKSVAAAKKVIKDLEDKVTELKEMIANRKEEVVTEKDLKSSNEESKDTTEKHKEKITPDCDWSLGAFQERVEKRAAEMEGLVKAKEYLAGAKPPSMLQVTHFDDTVLPSIGFEGLSFLQKHQ